MSRPSLVRLAKLNRCEICGSRRDLRPQFRADGRLYFLCPLHAAVLQQVLEVARRAGLDL